MASQKHTHNTHRPDPTCESGQSERPTPSHLRGPEAMGRRPWQNLQGEAAAPRSAEGWPHVRGGLCWLLVHTGTNTLLTAGTRWDQPTGRRHKRAGHQSTHEAGMPPNKAPWSSLQPGAITGLGMPQQRSHRCGCKGRAAHGPSDADGHVGGSPSPPATLPPRTPRHPTSLGKETKVLLQPG